MSFHDLGASCEPETCAGKLVSVVQSPECREDLLCGFGSDPDAVVPNGEDMFSPFTEGGNVDTGRIAPAELDGVADEVLEELADLGRVRDDFRERIMGHQCPLRMERPGEILQRDLQNGGRVDLLKWPGVGTGPRFQRPSPELLIATIFPIKLFYSSHLSGRAGIAVL